MDNDNGNVADTATDTDTYNDNAADNDTVWECYW